MLLYTTCVKYLHFKCVAAVNCVVSNEQLRGGDTTYDQARVMQYIDMADNELLPSICTWTFPTLGIMQYNANVS